MKPYFQFFSIVGENHPSVTTLRINLQFDVKSEGNLLAGIFECNWSRGCIEEIFSSIAFMLAVVGQLLLKIMDECVPG